MRLRTNQICPIHKWSIRICLLSPDYGTHGRIPRGKIIESCVILTVPPNSLLENFHDRMPVIVAPENYEQWMNPEIKFEAVKHLLKPYESSQMKEYPVSMEINNTTNKKADLDVHVAIEAPAQAILF